MEDKHKELAKDYFERHQLSNECHITSDERIFHTKGSADGFANTLEDNKVSSFTRASVVKVEKSGEDEKLNNLELLQTLELIPANHAKMLKLVKFFGIEIENNQAATLIKALTDYKANLQE